MVSTGFRSLPYSHSTGNPIPRPRPGHELKCNSSKPYHSGDTCFPTDFADGQEWALDQIFGRSVQGVCPLTDPDLPPVCIQVPHSRDVFTTAGATEIKFADGRSRCYQLPADDDFSLILPHISHEDPNDKKIDAAADELVPPESPPLYAERSLTGYGQERGGVQTVLTNPSPASAVEFVYFESLPWFMRIYLHTLRTHVEYYSPPSSPTYNTADQLTSGGGGDGEDKNKGDNNQDIIREVYYRPALDRVRGTQLELRIRIPPASRVVLTYDFEKTILRYTEYPPDANRGFDVAAAVITILDHLPSSPSIGEIPPADNNPQQHSSLPRQQHRGTSNLRTTGLLLSLPTPDFSMPYNVIIFTSTAIALAFGSLYNILVRRFVAADESPADLGAAAVLKRRILDISRKVAAIARGRGNGKVAVTTATTTASSGAKVGEGKEWKESDRERERENGKEKEKEKKLE